MPENAMSLTFHNPESVAPPDGQFSQSVAVEAGSRLIFISGQVPRNRNGETVGAGDMTAQSEQVFQNLQSILEAHGTDFSKAVKATIFVTDMKRADEVIAIRERFYAGAAPASTFVEVSALGHPDWLLEVELIAIA
jgi:reactive intermediate/imine deaminase